MEDYKRNGSTRRDVLHVSCHFRSKCFKCFHYAPLLHQPLQSCYCWRENSKVKKQKFMAENRLRGVWSEQKSNRYDLKMIRLLEMKMQTTPWGILFKILSCGITASETILWWKYRVHLEQILLGTFNLVYFLVVMLLFTSAQNSRSDEKSKVCPCEKGISHRSPNIPVLLDFHNFMVM